MPDLDQSEATEFNVVVRGKPRCDDWTTLDEALEQAEAFLGLGCDAVTIEQRNQTPSRGHSTYSPAVEAAFPLRGPCAFCGLDDQRHRVIDAIAERFRAGDSAEELAEDYGIDPALVPVIAAELATRSN